MESFKVLAKTNRIALLQVRFDNEAELKHFCDRLPHPVAPDVDGMRHEAAQITATALPLTRRGAALGACLITPDFQEAV